jgi:hypothetical protein
LLPEDCPLVEGVNVRLLRVREDAGWATMIGQLIGDQPCGCCQVFRYRETDSLFRRHPETRPFELWWQQMP